MLRLVLMLAMSCGCYVSPYARTGAVALAEGDYPRAVADYFRAHNDARADSAEEQAYHFEFQAAVHAWVLTEVTAAQRLAAGDEIDLALERVWGLVETPWLPDSARVAALTAVADLTEATWPKEVMAPADRGQFVNAVHNARRLVARFPADHAIRARLRDVEHRATAAHAALANDRGNHTYARRFHRCLGDYFAGEPRCQSDSPPSYRPVAWQLEPVVGECAWVGEGVAAKLGASAVGPTRVSLTVSACERKEERWTTEEQYTYLDQEPFIAEIDEPVLESAQDCPEPECQRRDALGTCVAWQQTEPCEPSTPTWSTRRKKVRRFQEVRREGVRTVHHARFTATVRGSARFLWEGAEITLPIAAEVELGDQAFWSPQEQVRFSGASLAGAGNQVLDQVMRVFDKFRGERVRRHGLATLDRAQTAAAAGDHGLAEDLYFESVRALGEVYSPAARYFFERYGVRETVVVTLANGEVPAYPTPRTEVPPMAAVSATACDAEDHLAQVSAKNRDTGPGRMFAVSVELAAAVEQSPLNDTDLATGVVATLRGGEGNVWLRWRLDTPNMGGDARGFGLEIVGGEKLGHDTLAFTSGLGYREQRNDAGERYALATIPLNLYWTPFSWLVLDAEARLNLIKIRDWVSGEPGDPGYGSPLSLGLTVQSRHLFIQARGCTWIGMDTEQTFYAGGLVGVRL